MKFRKKSIIVDAQQYTRNGLEAEKVAEWCGGRQIVRGCEVQTIEGPLVAEYGDWIIKNEKGEFSICKQSIFEELYEPV